MESLMQYASPILIVCLVLLTYVPLVVGKVLIMKIREDFLHEHGTEKELQDFLKKKNLKHVLTLGIL